MAIKRKPSTNGYRHPNGKSKPTVNSEGLSRMGLVVNQIMARANLAKMLFDDRRDIYAECGYPKDITPQMYKDMYDRDPIAERAVSVLPKECFQVQPEVYETEDSETVTPFEQSWDQLGIYLNGCKSWMKEEKGSAITDALLLLDIMSGIGSYAVMLLIIDDGKDLSQPADMLYQDELAYLKTPASTVPPEKEVAVEKVAGVEEEELDDTTDTEIYEEPVEEVEETEKPTTQPLRKLLGLEVYPESLAPITQWESNPRSPRYMKPLMYQITMNSLTTGQSSTPPITTRNVHWTRVIHVADNCESNKVFGNSRMKHIFNRLLDLQKIYGGDGEGYWKNAVMRLFFETLPQLGPDAEVDEDSFRDMMENLENGLQKWGLLKGLTAKSISPAIVDPTSHIAVHVEAITIKIGIPIRIFKGSERGELASTQDDDAWNDRVIHRQHIHVTPRIICPFVDRCILLRLLPEPEQYYVYWPDITSESESQKATTAAAKVGAIAAYIQSGMEQLIPPLYFFTRIMGWDEEEVNSMLTAAAEMAEQEGTTDEEAEEQTGEPVKEQVEEPTEEDDSLDPELETAMNAAIENKE